MWTHLVAQDSLLHQPGISIQPHSWVTAAPHPHWSLHTHTTGYVWTSTQHCCLSKYSWEISLNHCNLPCIDPSFSSCSADLMWQLHRSADTALLSSYSRVASSCFWQQQHLTLKSQPVFTHIHNTYIHTQTHRCSSQALQMSTRKVSQKANWGRSEHVINCTSILKNTWCSCCFLICRQRATNDLYKGLKAQSKWKQAGAPFPKSLFVYFKSFSYQCNSKCFIIRYIKTNIVTS